MRTCEHPSRMALLPAFVLVVLFGASGGEAQEPTAPRLAFEHDGQDVTGFALYAQPEEGKAIRVDLGLVPADGRGVRRVPLPVLPHGTYALSVAAYNAAGESSRVRTSPARLVVSDAPGGPDAPPRGAQAPASDAPPPASPDDGPPKTGPFSRLWRVIVGED